MTENANSKKKKTAAAAAAAVLAAVLAAGGTYSYYSSEAEAVTNTFDDNEVVIELTESDEDYSIVPGTSQSKDPEITVNASVDAFVYLIVTDVTGGLVEYEIDSVWELLYTAEDESGASVDIYYTTVSASVDEDGNSIAQTLNVLAGQQVWYSTSITNESFDDTDDITLSFGSYAIQADPFTDLSTDTASAAACAFADIFDSTAMSYLADYYTVVTTSAELDAALEDDAIIILGNDIEIFSNIEIKSDTVIYGNGYSIKESENTVSSRIFNITSDAGLTLCNITLDGTEAYANAITTSVAIFVGDSVTAEITLADCDITMANGTYFNTGILFDENSGGSLNVSNSKITAYRCISIYGSGVSVLAGSCKLTYINEFEDSDCGGWITVYNEETGDTGTTPYSTYGGASDIALEVSDTAFITGGNNTDAAVPEFDENDDAFGPVMFYNNTDSTCSAEVSGCTWDGTEYAYTYAGE